MIKGLVEDTVLSAQPAMVLDLRTCVSSPMVSHSLEVFFIYNKTHSTGLVMV